jgi:hypothetical protein
MTKKLPRTSLRSTEVAEFTEKLKPVADSMRPPGHGRLRPGLARRRPSGRLHASHHAAIVGVSGPSGGRALRLAGALTRSSLNVAFGSVSSVVREPRRLPAVLSVRSVG